MNCISLTKKRSALKTEWFILFLIFLFFIPVVADQYLPVSEVRDRYFIIKNPGTLTLKKMQIYALYQGKEGPAVGRAKIIDIYGQECLCVIEEKFLSLKNSSFKWMRIPVEKEPIRLWLNLDGQKPIAMVFKPAAKDKNHYISIPPLPAARLQKISLSRIRELLAVIDTKTGNRYASEFVSIQSILDFGLGEQINFSDNTKIYLGTEAGRIGMIYQKNGKYVFTGLSVEAIEQYQERIYLPILLRLSK